MTYGIKQLAALVFSAVFGLPTVLAAECEKVERVPPSAQRVRSETLTVPKTDTLSKGWEFESRATATHVSLVPKEPGYSEREQLFKLKSKPDMMAVFFVTTKGQSQAELEFMQVYMDNDPMGSPLGRTLAHELGHLLLGEGHTGGEQRLDPCDRAAAESAFQPKKEAPWTSGLMRAGNKSTATDVSAADAATARKNALAMPGAVYW